MKEIISRISKNSYKMLRKYEIFISSDIIRMILTLFKIAKYK